MSAPAVTFKRVGTGHFEVYVDGVLSPWGIVNGSLGASGRDRNVYLIVNGEKVRPIGSLASCKKILTYTISKEAK